MITQYKKEMKDNICLNDALSKKCSLFKTEKPMVTKKKTV